MTIHLEIKVQLLFGLFKDLNSDDVNLNRFIETNTSYSFFSNCKSFYRHVCIRNSFDTIEQFLGCPKDEYELNVK